MFFCVYLLLLSLFSLNKITIYVSTLDFAYSLQSSRFLRSRVAFAAFSIPFSSSLFHQFDQLQQLLFPVVNLLVADIFAFISLCIVFVVILPKNIYGRFDWDSRNRLFVKRDEIHIKVQLKKWKK